MDIKKRDFLTGSVGAAAAAASAAKAQTRDAMATKDVLTTMLDSPN